MRASTKSAWLAVGPGHDSLLHSSQNNTLALPAPLALLWSSNLVVMSSHCYSESLNSGKLSVIAEMPEHLFGKQGKRFLNSCILCRFPPVLYV